MIAHSFLRRAHTRNGLIAAVDIADADSDYMFGATVEISNNYNSGDVLGYVAPANNPITASWNVSTQTLTLSGTATKAQYEAALKAVKKFVWVKPGLFRRGWKTYLAWYLPGFHPWDQTSTSPTLAAWKAEFDAAALQPA